METNQDYAVLVTDVVWGSATDLIAWIRKQRVPVRCDWLCAAGSRVLHRKKVVKSLDINDYWSKTETTPGRIRTMLTGLIRSIATYQRYR